MFVEVDKHTVTTGMGFMLLPVNIRQDDYSEAHNVTFSFADPVYIVSGSIWTFYTVLKPRI